MTAIIQILPSGQHFSAEPNETLLEAGLRAGLGLVYRCSNGSCGECRMRVVFGSLSQEDFSDFRFSSMEREQGCALLCRAHTQTNLSIETRLVGTEVDIPHQKIAAKVNKLERLDANFLVLHLRTPRSQALCFLAGQHVRVQWQDFPARSMSIASCPCSGTQLQFHVRKLPGDPFCEALFSKPSLSAKMHIEGPRGNFFLQEKDPRPICMLAYETGFAPLKSLIEHAMALEWERPMHLYRIVSGDADPYLTNYCRAWADVFDNFTYTNLHVAPGAAAFPKAVDQVWVKVQSDHPALQKEEVYIAAPGPWGESLGKKLQQYGQPQHQIRIKYLDRYDEGSFKAGAVNGGL